MMFKPTEEEKLFYERIKGSTIGYANFPGVANMLDDAPMKLFSRVNRVGDRVRYVPKHADGNPHHPDCEDGTISNFGPDLVWIRFDRNQSPGQPLDDVPSKGCDPRDLRIL